MADNTRGSANPDGLDQFRLALTIEDRKEIDTDKSGSLNLLELMKAQENDIFKNTTNGADKQDAVQGLIDFCKRTPTRNISPHSDSVPSIRFWDKFDTALNNISEDEFEIIDSDVDGILSWKELEDGSKNQSLSKSARLAAGSLLTVDRPDHFLEAYSGEINEDPRGLVGPIGISDWHGLNKDFENQSSSSLRSDLHWRVRDAAADPNDTKAPERAKKMFDELLKRDKLIQPRSQTAQIQEFLVCNQAQLQNKGVERDASGKLHLTEAPMDKKDRLRTYGRMADILELQFLSSTDRTDYAKFMQQQKVYPEAEKLFSDATVLADSILEKPPGRKDSLKETVEQIKRRANNEVDLFLPGGKDMIYDALNSVTDGPATSRIQHAFYYMASARDPYSNSLQFDSTAPNFQPDKAEVLLDEAYKHWTKGSFVSKTKVLDSPLGMDCFNDNNKNGKSDLIDHIESQRKKEKTIRPPSR